MATWITTTKSSFANLDHFAHIYIAKSGSQYAVFGKSPGLSVTHDGEDRFDTIELFKGPEAECITAMAHIRGLIKPAYIA
jgi:hypothetical protein